MVIKPSEQAPRSAAVIERIVQEYLDNDCIKVVQGAIPETTALLEQQWDHIFYTGNGFVGRIVMQAAAKHLTPVTLELGGKNPVLVDKTANMETVVNRVFAAKSSNQGQVCVAPDFVIIDKDREDEFVTAFCEQVRASNFGEGSKENERWGKIVNERHTERLKRLIDTSGGRVMCGGSDDVDVAARHVPMTVIKDVSPDAPIMKEEIFGPVLPVVPVNDMREGLKMAKCLEHPLALYIFSEDKDFQESALQQCTSGGAGVNTAMEQLISKEAPFGGVGGSGMGKYHGKYGFDEFSHLRTVLYKGGSDPFLPHVENQPNFLYDILRKVIVGA
jgi:aldehyde dehydrogenase (NAD+)